MHSFCALPRRSRGDERADVLAGHGAHHVVGALKVVDLNRDFVLATHRGCRAVHAQIVNLSGDRPQAIR